MTRMIRSVALAVAFSASPVLAADQVSYEEVRTQSQSAQGTNDEHGIPVQTQKADEHDRTMLRSCDCKHDGKNETRAKPKLDLGVDSLVPVN